MSRASALLQRLQRRDLYRFVGSVLARVRGRVRGTGTGTGTGKGTGTGTGTGRGRGRGRGRGSYRFVGSVQLSPAP